MTSSSLSAISGPSRLEKLIDFGQTNIPYVLVIVISALFLTGPATPPLPTTEAIPAVESIVSDPQEALQAREPLPGNSLHRKAMESIAGVIAKKYRISQDATRSLIGAAYREGERIHLDPLLIIAVMAVESRFNPIAESDGGAVGLMQVIPRYHSDKLDPADLDSVLDPTTNIRLGARVLKDYIQQGGSEVAGLQLYNGASADPSNAYASKVLGEKQRLQQAMRRDL